MSHLSPHELCECARATRCSCGARPGCDCLGCPPGDLHICRFPRAVASGIGLIDLDDIGYLIRSTPKMTIHDPGAAA